MAFLKLLIRRTGMKPSSFPIRWISFISAGLFKIRMAEVEWLDTCGCAERTLLRAATTGFAYGPDDKKTPQLKVEVRIPEVYGYVLRDVLVSNNSSTFVKDGTVLIERLQSATGTPVNYNAGQLLFRKGKRAIVEVNPAATIEKGFFLGGNGSFNYYHWLVELLPKIEFLNSAPAGFPLLVSEHVNQYPSFKDALQMLVAGRELIYLKAGKQYAVKHLVQVSTASNLPFNVDPGVQFQVADFISSFASLDFLRKGMLMHAAPVATPGRRIFLKRDNNRRTYNQEAIEAILVQHGFVGVQCELLSFSEQVALFSTAEAIAGPTGAAWSNLVFASKGCKALCWMAGEYKTFASFSTLAAFAAVDMAYFYYPSGAKSTAELYNTGYQLDADAFARLPWFNHL